MISRTIREAVLLSLIAVILSVAYTASTKRGFFAPHVQLSPPAQGLRMIPLADAKAAFDAGNALFIDTRHPYEFQHGHIPHAVNIPLAELETRMNDIGQIARDRRLIVYCDGAECNSSIETGARFLERGFTDVRVFFGGWQEWNVQHLPVEGGAQ